ncbi:MAG TPA: hypothetical protein VJ717_14330 [Gemmatimonadaceae bacterium]|nr:hypothetical protein [Gemmatimonadaceae bacterium]
MTVTWTRRDDWCCVALAALALIAVVIAISPHPAGVVQDDGAYVILGKAIAEGEGYRFINLPNEPSATHFPPLYPLILAGLWKVSPPFPANIVVFKIANAVFLACGALGAFWFARHHLQLRPITAAIGTGVFVISAPLVSLATMVLSEAPFLALLFPTLVLAERAVAREGDTRALMAGLAAGALGLLRTLGILVLPALAVVLLVQRRWRAAGLAIVGAAVIALPWQLWALAHDHELPAALAGKYGSYLGWFLGGVGMGGGEFLLAVLRENLRHTGDFLSATFGAGGAHWLLRALLIATTVAVLVIGARDMIRRASVSATFVGGYVAVVLLWPFPPDRFYWAIWPLLGFAFVLGVQRAAQSVASSVTLRASVYAATALLVALYARPHLLGAPDLWIGQVQTAVAERSAPIVEWVGAATRPNDIIVTEDDALVYLYTGRHAVPAGAFTPQEYVNPQSALFASATLHSIIEAYPIRWVTPSTDMGVQASLGLVRRDPPALRFVGALTRGAVFQRVAATTEQP